VWVTTDDDLRDRPASLSFVPDDLGRTTTIEHDPAFGLSLDAVRRILPGERTVWLASNRGVIAVPLDSGAIRRWDASRGLTDQRALALAMWQQGVMVGTLRGVAFIGHDGEVRRPMPGMIRPVYSLFAVRDTLWIGTDHGLMAHVAGSPEPVGFRSWNRLLDSRTPVYGIGTVGDTLVAMTGSDLYWRDPATAEWITGPLLGGSLGLLRAFDATPRGVWIGGDRGAAFVQPHGAMLETLRVGAELPDAVTAIAGDDRFLWVGTMHGLVRFELRPR
jgi:ligand-binding sensor domain-containing protein